MKELPEVKPQRLQVFLARGGIASRRVSERYILDGRVKVNGVIVTDMGFKVFPTDSVLFDDSAVVPEELKRYFVLHKPAGYICALEDPEGRPLASDLLKKTVKERVYNVGRLDFYSTGLILYTNDGDFAMKISHPSGGIEKEYLVETSQAIPDIALDSFRRGITVDSIRYRAQKAERLSPTQANITLVEGKNREIRKVLAFFNVYPKTLRRIRIGPVFIGNLQEGEFRELTELERYSLLEQARENTHGSGD